MKKIISIAASLCFTIILMQACSSSNTTDVKTTPEMEQFMKTLDGKYQSVTDAIIKFAVVPDLNTADMDMKDLRDPVIISASQSDSSTCYTIKTNDGAKDCQYELCWKAGKIISITDKTPE